MDSLPDSSSSSRRPPTLSFRDGSFTEPRIQVHAHMGCILASGTHIVGAHVHHMRIYDLSLSDIPQLCLDAKDTAKDAKITCMELRLDESGKALVFALDTFEIFLANTQPRVVRTTEKQDFVRLFGGKLGTAAHSEHHGISLTQKMPIIRVYNLFNPASTGRSLLPSEHVGAVTSATYHLAFTSGHGVRWPRRGVHHHMGVGDGGWVAKVRGGGEGVDVGRVEFGGREQSFVGWKSEWDDFGV